MSDERLEAHERAVEAGDWERVRDLERDLVEPSDNTDRPEDGPQPDHHPVGEDE